jgi:hypothetical protein
MTIDTTYNYILYHCSQVHPDNNTMKHKYISTQSNELLSYFNDKGKVCFDSKTALKAFPEAKESTVRELLSDMTKRGLLMRIKDGVYYIIPYEENSENFYVISYLENKKELAVYKGNSSVNWNKPIFTVPLTTYYSDTVISDTELNNEHTIIFTSSTSTFQKPLVLKNKGDNFSTNTLFSNDEDLHKNASHSLVLNSKNHLLLFQAFNPNFFDIAGFYIYDLKNKKTVGTYPKKTTNSYYGLFLPNDDWMIAEKEYLYQGKHKYYANGTFDNRYNKLNFNNYLQINHNIESIISSFFDKKKGLYVFLGKDKTNDSKYYYYEYDLINDKVNQLYAENKNFLFIADFNAKTDMLLLNEQEYTNQSGTPSRIIILPDGKSLEFSDTYKFSKFSENGNYLLTINKDNTAEVRQLPDNKVLYSKQLDNGNYDIISIGDSNFSINTNLTSKDKTSNCYTKTQIISIENDVVSNSVKDCLLISDVSYVNENMAMIIDNTVVVVNDKPLLFKGLESPKYISFNSDASKFMLSFKNGYIIVYETTTFQELGRMIHPDENSHVFLDTKGNYFSNIDAKDYLWATKNNTPVSLKSIDKETFKPEELLSIFGTPNKDYTKVLQKAVNLRAETKPKADEKTTKNSTNIPVEELGKPNLYLLSIGVSDYKQSNYNLTFADKDALDITKIYGTLTYKEFINYQDKFFGDAFTLYDKNGKSLKSVNKYLGSSYRRIMYFYSVGSENKWLEQTDDKINLWNFDQKTIDSIAIPKDFIHTSYDYDNKLFSTANDSGFSLVGSENKVLSYNCSTKKSKQYKLPDGEFTNYALIEEDQWLLFNYKHIDSTSTISLSIFDGTKNKTTQKLKINPHKYLNRSLNGEVKSIDVKNYSSYIIPALRAVSSNGKYLMYEAYNEALFFVDITQNNPKPIKINPQNVLNYSSKISIAPDGKTFCVLNYKDKTYTTTIIDMNGKPIETHTIENNDFAVRGISIIDANPKWIKQTDQLLKDGFFEMEDIKLF